MPSRSPEGQTAYGRSMQSRDQRSRILILIPTLAVGGAEMDLVRTLPKIDRSRFEATVCTFLDRGTLGEILQKQGIEIIGPLSTSLSPLRQFLRAILRRIAKGLLPFGAAGRLSGYLTRLFLTSGAILYLLEVVRLARPIARYIRRSEVDVIHTILPVSYLVGACASMLAGRRPVLMSRLSLNLYQQDDRVVGLIERRILHGSVDAAIGNSNAVLQNLKAEGIPDAKLHLVYNGIDAQAFAKEMTNRTTARRLMDISEDVLVFSVVANLHPYKGHEDLLHALATISDILSPDWRCLVVGKDIREQLQKLQQLCVEHGLTRNVMFLGPRSDVPIILSASDIHISASHQEGLPNNILEAMCARLPVVATAVGGVSELVVNGETGFLVPPREPGQLAGALGELIRSPDRRTTFGQAGHARAVSQFSIDRNIKALEAIYSDLAKKCKNRIPANPRY